ncbi:MAG: SUF system Fe-S cluster assembly protein [Kordiimonadaceae bacterium]|nr:SUF system Fe-S cluster assembly protein [Kordiimonadaceae bacterium]MBO6568126.1 SUF system Fe-S cluster assembly protein [Kordiimonadaceae bacterium]MBO6964144.1 SUF system Fe-S cluster assembly protein [Kordiimonadaceae bacterium]
MTSEAKRDVLDVSTPQTPNDVPDENKPVTAERPVVSPQEGAYFLDKFLAEKDEPAEDAAPAEAQAAPATKEELQANIVAALQEIYDPEIPVNIYELGLIYGVDVAEDFSAYVTMTLTTPHCPVAESMPGEVELKVASVAGVNGVTVDLVWDPPWDMSKMSDEARLELGLL